MSTGIDFYYTSTAAAANEAYKIASEPYAFVGVYLGGSSQYLTGAEAASFADSGLRIVSLFERSPNSASYFTTTQADADASDAILSALKVGQPLHSAIYFTVDFEPTTKAQFTAIDTYFERLRADLDSLSFLISNVGPLSSPDPYAIGVYGPGDVLSMLAKDGAVHPDYTWIDTWAWKRNGFSGENLQRVQNQIQATPIALGFDVDLDTAQTSDFGQWNGQSSTGSEIVYIRTLADLALVRNNLSGHYVLLADIRANGASIPPIGSPANPFTGTFDGNGHTINGLNVVGNGIYVGLFASIGAGGTVSDLGLHLAAMTLADWQAVIAAQ
jgi:hypothetical protein